MLAIPIANAGLSARSRKSRPAGSTKSGSTTAPARSCPLCFHAANEQPGQFIPCRAQTVAQDKHGVSTTEPSGTPIFSVGSCVPARQQMNCMTMTAYRRQRGIAREAAVSQHSTVAVAPVEVALKRRVPQPCSNDYSSLIRLYVEPYCTAVST